MAALFGETINAGFKQLNVKQMRSLCHAGAAVTAVLFELKFNIKQ